MNITLGSPYEKTPNIVTSMSKHSDINVYIKATSTPTCKSTSSRHQCGVKSMWSLYMNMTPNIVDNNVYIKSTCRSTSTSSRHQCGVYI
jgi:hypothetical protein